MVNIREQGDDELAFLGLARQAELLAEGGLGAVELLESTLRRIEASQPSLNAFRLLSPYAARAEAIEAERCLAAGDRRPLLGVPIAVKDDMDLAGEPTSFGCEGEFEPCREDGEVVRRLRAAGAVIVGKTNTPEIGQWPFTEGPAFGVTRNPWSLDHSPGGSSGGAAAAVAAGLLPAAVGSDGAGSVRIPAAWTHLVGLKPQRGRVSTWPAPESFNGLTSFGPLARSVGDAALLLDVLAGSVAGDLHRPPAPEEPFATAARRDPGRLRIALALNVPFSGSPAQLDSVVREAVEGVASTLEGLGHGIEVLDVPYGLAPGISIMPRSMVGIREWAGRAPDRGLLDPRTHHAARLGRAFRPLLGIAHLAEKVAHRAGRPTSGSSPPAPTPGPGTSSAGPASTSPRASPPTASLSVPSSLVMRTARRCFCPLALSSRASAGGASVDRPRLRDLHRRNFPSEVPEPRPGPHRGRLSLRAATKGRGSGTGW